MLSITLLTLTLTFVSSVISTGVFLYPSGTDGSLAVTTGNTIDISWTNTTDYDILSLGYYSTSNQTITWLIVNSQSNPTSYRWTVDAVAQGFNLADSRLFAFYICKDMNFGDPFISSYFVINDASSSSSSSSAASSTSTSISSTSTLPSVITPSNSPSVTSTTASASTSASSAASSTSSSGLSTGAKAGIAVGIIVGILGAALIAFLFVRHRRKTRQAQGAPHIASEVSSDIMTGEKMNMHHGSDNLLKPTAHSGAHEMSVENNRPAELGAGNYAGNETAELPVDHR